MITPEQITEWKRLVEYQRDLTAKGYGIQEHVRDAAVNALPALLAEREQREQERTELVVELKKIISRHPGIGGTGDIARAILQKVGAL